MGYTTQFVGRFTISPPLTPEHQAYLEAFAKTRHMKRDPDLTSQRPDSLREAVGLPAGAEGGYFVGAGGFRGQEYGAPDILEYNEPPEDQPGLWCQWVPTEDGAGLEWNEAEKFYAYTEWLTYLLDHFLTPWGYSVSGSVKWQGEDMDDRGRLTVEGNRVTAQSLE